MELVAETFEVMINAFTQADELMDFAATWGIQESLAVRYRLFQLRQSEYSDDTVRKLLNSVLATLGGPLQTSVTVDEENMELALDCVKEHEEIEGSVKALLFDDEMDALTQSCEDDGDWYPSSHIVQRGCGDEPQQGMSSEPQLGSSYHSQPIPSHRPENRVEEPQAVPSHRQKYTMRKKAERTYAMSAVVDRTYQVKVDEQYHGRQLRDVRQGLHHMFQDAMNQARGDLAGNYLGRVVIHHEGMHDPIIVPLQVWDGLNAYKVMETLENVLNSNQELSINDSFSVTIGTIDLPKGGKRRRITRIKGPKNSSDLNKSIVTIVNNDNDVLGQTETI